MSTAEFQEAAGGAPEIRLEEIEFNPDDRSSLLGEGSFGSVYKGKCRGINVAVKIPNTKLSEEQVDEFKEEVKIMSKLFNPRIALFMGAYIPDNFEEDIIIVSEVLHGDIKTKLVKDAKKKQLSLYQRMTWAKQAAEGMTWLHGAGVIHRDLKPSNLLYDRNTDSVKVCDFGLSALVPKGNALQGEAKGTPLYVAPELVQGGDTTHAADVYSFGITLSMFLTRKPPFQHHTDLTAFLEAVCYDDERPDLPEDPLECPESIRQMCESCWQGEPEDRPTFEKILTDFDAILVDSAIFDPVARAFWKKRFIDAKEGVITSVRWDSFAKYFDRSFGSDSVSLLDDETFYGDCMKELFAQRVERRDVVTLPHFGHMLGFFSPIEEKQGQWLTDTCSLLSKAWFWGSTSSQAAHKALSTAPDGSYLIRFSSSGNNYTISFRQGGQVWHTRINHRYLGDSYVLDTTSSSGKEYDSLIGVIQSMMSMQDGLKAACAGGPFQSIFSQNRAALGGYAKVQNE